VGLAAELFLLPALVRVLAPALPLRAPALAREAS
jgi:hypothetical protein